MPRRPRPSEGPTRGSGRGAADADAPQVLVVGAHPAAHLAAMLLTRAGVGVRLHDPGTLPLADRLIVVNPAVFRLAPEWASLAQVARVKVDHVRFLGDAGESADAPAGPVFLADAADVGRETASAVASVARGRGALRVTEIDEAGVAVETAGWSGRVKLVLATDPLPPDLAGPLGVEPLADDASPVQAVAEVAKGGDGPPLAMGLDLGGRLGWGWLLRTPDRTQVCVQPGTGGEARATLDAWVGQLKRAGLLAGDATLRGRAQAPLPLAGALTREVVARRTLLAGPAGGFYSASGEDFYPNCWSAKFAAEVAVKAVGAAHVQDALAAYRSKWGSTLGDYLRGPQQNLRFLLPLVYKNPVMTARLAESILLGAPLVK